MTKEKKEKPNKKPSVKKKKPRVIRKLRVEFITVMMAIVVVFLAVIFGVQYFSTRRSLEEESREALEASINSTIIFFDGIRPAGTLFIWDQLFPGGRSSEEESGSEESNTSDQNSDEMGTPPGGMGRRNDRNLSNFRDKNSRTATLVAVISEDGSSVSIRQNDIFFINANDVSSLINTALAGEETSGKIADHDLRFMKRTLSDGSIAVAFADISGELSMLRSEIIRSVWISLAVLIVMFFLSLILSKLTIRPVEKAWDNQRQFVADASHELKTPLTVIMSNTDMVQRSLQKLLADADENALPASKLERNLHRMDNVHEESLRMKELIGELLEVARGDVGQNTAGYTELSLSELVEDSLITWESIFFERGKILTGNAEPDIKITGDRTTLRRLTEILIDNALKYSFDKSTTTVSLKKEKLGSKKVIHLSVANEGTPLTPEEISHLFDRFYRADSSREKTSGYGLGLSIAEAIVEAHKGKIWAEADGTRGNIFHVTFPL